MKENSIWNSTQHERRVEKFYSSGLRDFHEYHGGYLNFGYWTQRGMSYIQAAENLVKKMGQTLGLDKTSNLLDVGCGMGSQDVFLINNFPLASIDAVDVTWKHIEIARERAKRAGLNQDRLRFHHGTGTKLAFPENTFTHALSIEAPEHMDTREDFFREAFRVLKPGGVLAVADYSLPRKPSNIFEKLLVEFARRLWEVPKANAYGNEVFQDKLRQIGFRDVVIENIGQWTIPGYFFEHQRPEARKEIKKVRGWFKGVVGGFLIDWGVYRAFKKGLCEYIIIRAKKPAN